MADYTIRALAPDTWEAFADLAERHNGVWGGCWCTWFHTLHPDKSFQVADNRSLKERLVREGRAHAALVFDGERAVGWCQYGSPEELPNIYHRKEYAATTKRLPEYRITCFFVDSAYRRKGVAAAALRGALDLIAQAGGGVVESYPRDTQGKRMTASFLYNASKSMFEEAGFRFDRQKGQFNTVMVKKVAAKSRKSGGQSIQ